MWINDRPLAAFGLEPNTSEDRVGGPLGSLVIEEIPNQSGAQLIRSELNRPRRLIVPVAIRASTEHTDDQSFRSRLDDVQDALRGALEVRFDDDPDHIFFCQLEVFRTLGVEAPEFRATTRELEMVLVAVDPFRYDRFVSTSGAGAIAVGTAPSRLITIIQGPATDPSEIELRDLLGRIVARIRITDALLAGESFVIRHNNFRVDKFTGVETKVAAIDNVDRTVDLFNYFTVTPELADRRAGSFPTIEVSDGGGILTNLYRRGWQ